MATPDYRDTSTPTETRETREVIVTDSGRQGTNLAGVVVAVLAIIVFGILGYLAVSALDSGGDEAVQMPDEVDVNVDPGSTGTE